MVLSVLHKSMKACELLYNLYTYMISCMDDDLPGLNVSKWLRRTWQSSTGFYNTHGAQAIDLGAMAFPNLKGPGFKCPKHHWNQGIKSVQIYHDWNCRRILLAFFSPLEQCLRPLTSLASRFIILFANGLIWASWPQDTMYTCQDQVHPQLLLLFLILRIEYWTTVTFWIFLPRLRSL